MADLGQPVLTNYAEMAGTTMVPGGAYVPHGTWSATAEGVIVVEYDAGRRYERCVADEGRSVFVVGWHR